MNEFNTFNALQEAWETSTISNNRFSLALVSVCVWDEVFYSDGEYNFAKGGFLFSTPSFDPFEVCGWKPSALFSDGSIISF